MDVQIDRVMPAVFIIAIFAFFGVNCVKNASATETAVVVNGHKSWEEAYQDFRDKWQEANGKVD